LDIETRLQEIIDLDRELFMHFKDKFSYPEELSRSLVSFQSNKAKPLYRWYKYKEAFSADLVHYLLEKYRLSSGKVLDPFAGSWDNFIRL
jgi:DNA modification methylase